MRSSKDPSQHSFTKLMQDALAERNFSSLCPDSLPISGPLISESLIKDSGSLRRESLKFAIMARNLELLESILKEANVGQGVLDSFLRFVSIILRLPTGMAATHAVHYSLHSRITWGGDLWALSLAMMKIV